MNTKGDSIMSRIGDFAVAGMVGGLTNSILGTQPQKTGEINVDIQKAHKDVAKRDLEAKSKIGDEKPTKASLKKMGFEEQPMMDMNGGVYYKNKDGDVIRIAGWDGQMLTGPEGSSCVTFISADGKTKQEVVFDPSGEPIKGQLNITCDDETIDAYSYEYDLNGNKSVEHFTVY
jgi:hypothetical protein